MKIDSGATDRAASRINQAIQTIRGSSSEGIPLRTSKDFQDYQDLNVVNEGLRKRYGAHWLNSLEAHIYRAGSSPHQEEIKKEIAELAGRASVLLELLEAEAVNIQG